MFDLPETVGITRELIAREGLEHAAGTIEGDFLVDDLGTGFDLVLMSSVLHIYSPAQNRRLIKKGYRALRPGGRIVVRDHMLAPGGTAPKGGAMFSLNMLVNTEGGAAYTEREIRSWLKSAGFEKIKRLDIGERTGILTGMKPK